MVHALDTTPVLSPLAHRIHDAVAPRASDRDVATIRRWLAVLERYAALFDPRVEGAHHIPETGPALLVGNHSLFWVTEGYLAARTVFERRGIDAPLNALAYDLLFAVPWLGSQLRKVGTIPAAPDAAHDALRRGEAVMVYPGGDLDACRSWSQKDRVELGGRKGFVRLALRTGVPVVPVVTHGGQHMVVVLNRGDRLARAMGLNRLRIKVFPLFAGPPFGISSVLTPPPPLPAAVSVEFLPPLDWSGYDADDPAAVDACYEEITTVMQAALDRLAKERPHPVVTGVGHLLAAPARAVLSRTRSSWRPADH